MRLTVRGYTIGAYLWARKDIDSLSPPIKNGTRCEVVGYDSALNAYLIKAPGHDKTMFTAEIMEFAFDRDDNRRTVSVPSTLRTWYHQVGKYING